MFRLVKMAVLVLGLASMGLAAQIDLDTLGGNVLATQIINQPKPLEGFDASIPGFVNAGSVVSTVWADVGFGVFTYIYDVMPSSSTPLTINNISEVNTSFKPFGFHHSIHDYGWSFSDAAAAGGLGDSLDFGVDLDPDGTIDWFLRSDNLWVWSAGDSIRLFYQSSIQPGSFDNGRLNIINGTFATAAVATPVPEPGSLVLLLAGGLATILIRRRQS